MHAQCPAIVPQIRLSLQVGHPKILAHGQSMWHDFLRCHYVLKGAEMPIIPYSYLYYVLTENLGIAPSKVKHYDVQSACDEMNRAGYGYGIDEVIAMNNKKVGRPAYSVGNIVD